MLNEVERFENRSQRAVSAVPVTPRYFLFSLFAHRFYIIRCGYFHINAAIKWEPARLGNRERECDLHCEGILRVLIVLVQIGVDVLWFIIFLVFIVDYLHVFTRHL